MLCVGLLNGRPSFEAAACQCFFRHRGLCPFRRCFVEGANCWVAGQRTNLDAEVGPVLETVAARGVTWYLPLESSIRSHACFDP